MIWGVPCGDLCIEIVELLAVIFFTVEYFLRLYAAPEHPRYRTAGYSDGCARLNYMVSFYAVVDALAVVPYYVAIWSPFIDE